MRTIIFIISLFMAVQCTAQDACRPTPLASKTTYLEVASKLGIGDSLLTMGELSGLSPENRRNKMVDMSLDNGVAFVGSLDRNGYDRCVDLFSDITTKAEGVFGQKEVLKSDIHAPDDVSFMLDPQAMDEAIREGEASIYVIWKYRVGTSQQLAISLICNSNSYYCVMTLQNNVNCSIP